MTLESLHNLILNYRKETGGEKPKTIHFNPQDSEEFIKDIKDFISDNKVTNEIQRNFYLYSKYPENLELYGMKVRFSYDKTILY